MHPQTHIPFPDATHFMSGYQLFQNAIHHPWREMHEIRRDIYPQDFQCLWNESPHKETGRLESLEVIANSRIFLTHTHTHTHSLYKALFIRLYRQILKERHAAHAQCLITKSTITFSTFAHTKSKHSVTSQNYWRGKNIDCF